MHGSCYVCYTICVYAYGIKTRVVQNIDTIDGRGLSNEACRDLLRKNSKCAIFVVLIFDTPFCLLFQHECVDLTHDCM